MLLQRRPQLRVVRHVKLFRQGKHFASYMQVPAPYVLRQAMIGTPKYCCAFTPLRDRGVGRKHHSGPALLDLYYCRQPRGDVHREGPYL